MTATDLPESRERDAPPGPGRGGPAPDVWVYNGRAYDLSDWIAKHPGGAFFIGRTRNRDITSIVRTYHPNPEVIEKTLERYSLGRDATPQDIHPKNNAPPFLFKDEFNSWRDTPKFRFDDDNDLLHRVRARLQEPVLAARIKRMDTLFNVIVVMLAVGVRRRPGTPAGHTRLDAAADLHRCDGGAAQFVGRLRSLRDSPSAEGRHQVPRQLLRS